MKKLLLLIGVLALLLVPLLTSAQPPEVPPPLPDPSGSGVVIEDPTGVLTKLVKQWPWFATLIGWIITLRLAAKPFSGWLQTGMDKLLLFTKSTPQLDDDALVARLLGSWVYRLIAFMVDWATSIKLPTTASVADTLTAKVEKAEAKANLPTALLLVVCVGLALGTSGCAWFHPEKLKPVAVAPGQDVYLVNAERVHASSFETYKTLTNWELNSREQLPVEVSRAVDQVRREFPPAWGEADKILADYRATRGGGTNDLERLTAALSVAQASMLRLKADNGQVTQMFTALTDLTTSVAALRRP
jgi:hypothetical protein